MTAGKRKSSDLEQNTTAKKARLHGSDSESSSSDESGVDSDREYDTADTKISTETKMSLKESDFVEAESAAESCSNVAEVNTEKKSARQPVRLTRSSRFSARKGIFDSMKAGAITPANQAGTSQVQEHSGTNLQEDQDTPGKIKASVLASVESTIETLCTTLQQTVKSHNDDMEKRLKEVEKKTDQDLDLKKRSLRQQVSDALEETQTSLKEQATSLANSVQSLRKELREAISGNQSSFKLSMTEMKTSFDADMEDRKKDYLKQHARREELRYAVEILKYEQELKTMQKQKELALEQSRVNKLKATLKSFQDVKAEVAELKALQEELLSEARKVALPKIETADVDDLQQEITLQKDENSKHANDVLDHIKESQASVWKNLKASMAQAEKETNDKLRQAKEERKTELEMRLTALEGVNNAETAADEQKLQDDITKENENKTNLLLSISTLKKSNVNTEPSAPSTVNLENNSVKTTTTHNLDEPREPLQDSVQASSVNLENNSVKTMTLADQIVTPNPVPIQTVKPNALPIQTVKPNPLPSIQIVSAEPRSSCNDVNDVNANPPQIKVSEEKPEIQQSEEGESSGNEIKPDVTLQIQEEEVKDVKGVNAGQNALNTDSGKLHQPSDVPVNNDILKQSLELPLKISDQIQRDIQSVQAYLVSEHEVGKEVSSVPHVPIFIHNFEPTHQPDEKEQEKDCSSSSDSEIDVGSEKDNQENQTTNLGEELISSKLRRTDETEAVNIEQQDVMEAMDFSVEGSSQDEKGAEG